MHMKFVGSLCDDVLAIKTSWINKRISGLGAGIIIAAALNGFRLKASHQTRKVDSRP